MSQTALGTALITGASSGIGAVYAERLAKRGYDLVLTARDAARLQTLAARLAAETGRHIDVLPADLASPDGRDAVAARLDSDSRITLLINNAGMALHGGLLDTPLDEIEQLIAVNITAPTRLARAAGQAFAGRKRGAIVNIASVLALAPEVFDGVYSGSKAYLLNLSRRLAQDLQPSNVHVQAVLPGATRTEIWARSGKDADQMRPGSVMDVYDLVDAALLGLDKGETITIPPLADDGQWEAYDAARLAMLPNLSTDRPAPRYRIAA